MELVMNNKWMFQNKLKLLVIKVIQKIILQNLVNNKKEEEEHGSNMQKFKKNSMNNCVKMKLQNKLYQVIKYQKKY